MSITHRHRSETLWRYALKKALETNNAKLAEEVRDACRRVGISVMKENLLDG